MEHSTTPPAWLWSGVAPSSAPKLISAFWQVSFEAQHAVKVARLQAAWSISASKVGVGRANVGLSMALGAFTALKHWMENAAAEEGRHIYFHGRRVVP